MWGTTTITPTTKALPIGQGALNLTDTALKGNTLYDQVRSPGNQPPIMCNPYECNPDASFRYRQNSWHPCLHLSYPLLNLPNRLMISRAFWESGY